MSINESVVIDKIRLVEIDIPFATPFQISGGISYTRKSLIIEMVSDGIVAYGESAPFEAPFYSSETISSVKAVLKEWIFPRLINKEIQSIEELNAIISEGIRGNNFAKTGVENAYWDLIAKKNKLSLKELIIYKLEQLGTPKEFLESVDYVESGVSVGIPEDRSYDTLAKWVKDYVDEGYRRIKIKVKKGWDVEATRVTREVIGPEFPLWIDANASFKIEEDIPVLKEIDQYNCLFYEQPLHHDDIIDHSDLKEQVQTPICFDESLKSAKVAKHILKLDVSKIWNIKIQRVGGLLEALKIYKIAVTNGVKLWGGTMPESGIGAMPILNLASFKGFVYPADIEPSSRWYGQGKDIIEMEMTDEGKIFLQSGLGIGDINEDNYKKYGKEIVKLG